MALEPSLSFDGYPIDSLPDVDWNDGFLQPEDATNIDLYPTQDSQAFSLITLPLPFFEDTTSLQKSPSMVKNDLSWSPPTPASDPEEAFQTPPPLRKGKSRSRSQSSVAQSSRTSHCAVEQKYRQSVNSAIQRLQKALPASSQSKQFSQLTKAGIIASGADYMKSLQRECDRLKTENDALRDAAKRDHLLLEQLALRGNFLHSMTRTSGP
jgi:hypothetical protein